MRTINLSDGTTNYPLNTPQYGYTTTIKVAMIHTEHLPRGYGIWDNGKANDYRMCSCNWILDATDTATLRNLFDDLTKGRGVDTYLKLGMNSGFYPFGPDLGDSNQFQVRMTNIVSGPVAEAPWMWFNTEIQFVMIAKPSYSLPAEISEGDLQIGNISGLRYSMGMPQSSHKYAFATQVTRDGTPYTIDKLEADDRDVAKLSMTCNQSKAAALIDDLVETQRDSLFHIISQANNYIFGLEGGDADTYTCQWLNEVVEIKHNAFDRFSFDLSFYKT